MPARVLDGRAIAARVRADVAARASALVARTGRRPGLAVVVAGDDEASRAYVRGKAKAAREVGFEVFDHSLAAGTPQAMLEGMLARWGADARVDGILVQLPLPADLDARAAIEAVPPDKDVDGLHPVNVGRLWSGDSRRVAPCTPRGVMRLLEEAGAPLAGAEAVVVGRSNLVGKPVAALLLEAGATVTMCHSSTRGLAEKVMRADVLVTAVGRPGLVEGAWVKPGATVVDVGLGRLPSGALAGDVGHAAAAERAAAITPVPGGVGPLTVAYLLVSTLELAERHTGG